MGMTQKVRGYVKLAGAAAALASSAAIAMMATALAQAPPNLPPPGAYTPIPNFSGVRRRPSIQKGD